MKKRVRFDSFDIMRGLAMMVIICWHTMNIHSVWTDGWVMPSFFIVMGVFYRQVPTFGGLLKKKAKSILIPYLVFSVPALLMSVARDGYANTFKILVNPYKCIYGSAWFLVCMFLCYVIYWSLNKLFEGKEKIRVAFSMLISFLAFYVSQCHIVGHRIVLPFFLTTSLECLAFIEIGYLLKPYVLSSISGFGNEQRKTTLLISGGVFLFLFDVFVLVPEPLDMIWSDYGVSFDRFVFDGSVGTMMVLIMTRLFQRILLPIKWIGQNSLLILLLHGYVLAILHLIGVDKDVLIYMSTLVLTTMLAHLISKYLPVLAGK